MTKYIPLLYIAAGTVLSLIGGLMTKAGFPSINWETGETGGNQVLMVIGAIVSFVGLIVLLIGCAGQSIKIGSEAAQR